MTNRIFSGLIVVFWVSMMAALVRVEFFPTPAAVDSVSNARVLQKIFTNPDQRLNVYYQGTDIGSCSVEILPIRAEGGEAAAPRAFDVSSKVHLKLTALGIPAHLVVKAESRFNQRYEIEKFHIRTAISGGHIDVSGDDQTRKVKVAFDLGELHTNREFDFAQAQSASLINALGLPGLANASVFGEPGTGALTGVTGGGRPAVAPTTTTMLTSLTIGELTQRAYLVETRLEDRAWAKMWVAENGGILRVETSMGLMMECVDCTEERTAKVSPPHARASQPKAANDSNRTTD